jgi:hypothetical protein
MTRIDRVGYRRKGLIFCGSVITDQAERPGQHRPTPGVFLR